MSPQLFDYKSPRARRARLAHRFAHKQTNTLLFVAGWLVITAGILMATTAQLPLGWLIAGLGAPFLMVSIWGNGLTEFPPRSNPQTIDDVLELDVLGILPEKHTPEDLVRIVSGLSGNRFFSARFGLNIKALDDISSASAADTAVVWQEAMRIRQLLALPTISSTLLTAVLYRTAPGNDMLFARLHLSPDDLIAGVAWYEQNRETLRKMGRRKHDGGVGRDWAFGYTPLLGRFGSNVSETVLAEQLVTLDLPSRQTITKQIAHLLTQGGRHNATLVGSLGSGKTTIVRELAKKLLEADSELPHNMHYWQVIALDPSTLIAEASGRGELEGLVQHMVYEALRAKNIVLFLDDAQLFFEEGNGSVNLANVLLPILEGGALRIILAMDEQRWLRISQANPALAQCLNRIQVVPLNERETLSVMEHELPIYEYQQKSYYTYQSLVSAYRLSSRYIAEQVMPGRALKLLEAAGSYPEDSFITEHSVEDAIERTQGIKVSTAHTQDERETLLNLEQLIHERMINQTHAVQVVSDALRRARAGVRNAARPIGTFLFLGPTGVGKTELAKSVAAVFFGGEDHMVRLDLNEYSGSNDVQRLIADAADDQHSLTAQIARNPFSVVLLDEIEKAHPNVINTLLQLLDEGILRDINNREVSFRDAVIIATSNAGADKIRQHIEAGEQLERFEEAFTNELINSGEFRPEFLNRFDEIVLFRPLKPDELVQVIDLILKGINKNLETQKVSVLVDEDAKQVLVKAGYDPRLGARPMRRVVQRAVENIVANRMLAGAVAAGSEIHITASDVQAMLQRGSSS